MRSSGPPPESPKPQKLARQKLSDIDLRIEVIQAKIDGLEKQKATLLELKQFATAVESADVAPSTQSFAELLQEGGVAGGGTRKGHGKNQAYALFGLNHCGGSATATEVYFCLQSLESVPFSGNGRGQAKSHKITLKAVYDALAALHGREYVSASGKVESQAKSCASTIFTLEDGGRRELSRALGLEHVDEAS